MSAARSIGQPLVRVGRALTAVSAWPGRAASWLLVPLAIAVLGTVVGSLLQMGNIVDWGMRIPLLGTGLTLNSLNELQWHMLAVITMLALPYALAQNRHVRVDMLHAGFSLRGKVLVDLLGDLFLLLPFCIVIGYLSINFAAFAFKTGEQSTYGGLIDRWLVKSVLPIGLGLLLLTGIGRILSNIGWLLTGGEETRHD